MLNPDLPVRKKMPRKLLGITVPKDFILRFIDDQVYLKNEHAV